MAVLRSCRRCRPGPILQPNTPPQAVDNRPVGSSSSYTQIDRKNSMIISATRRQVTLSRSQREHGPHCWSIFLVLDGRALFVWRCRFIFAFFYNHCCGPTTAAVTTIDHNTLACTLRYVYTLHSRKRILWAVTVVDERVLLYLKVLERERVLQGVTYRRERVLQGTFQRACECGQPSRHRPWPTCPPRPRACLCLFILS
jgi:hypothetical protein